MSHLFLTELLLTLLTVLLALSIWHFTRRHIREEHAPGGTVIFPPSYDQYCTLV